MISSEVQRTLVKSPPELWAELSDPAALARHLGELGEIRITRTEPEKIVEWEADATHRQGGAQALGLGHQGHADRSPRARGARADRPEPEPRSMPSRARAGDREPEPEPMVAERARSPSRQLLGSSPGFFRPS